MTVSLSIGFTPASEQLIARWDRVSTELVENIDDAFSQFITEVESFVKSEYFGEGKDIKNRSGSLRQAVKGEVTGPLSGFVGTTRGTTTPYARPILGPGTTTITPKAAKHLWVPIGKNLNPSGIARFTPKGIYDAFGKERIRIFKSKKGNTVVFVQDEKSEDGSHQRYKRATKSGRQKGEIKGRLMFVLKDQVVIQGTDALAKGAQRMMPRGTELLNNAVARSFPGGGA